MEAPRVSLREITDANRDAVRTVRVTAAQVRFVGSVAGALEDATEYAHANPSFRAVYAQDEAVGFVMLSRDGQAGPARDHRSVVPMEAVDGRIRAAATAARWSGRSPTWYEPRARPSY